MKDNRLISETELRTFFPGTSLAGEAQALLLQQQSTWDLARLGFTSLKSVKTKSFDFDGITYRVQYNAGRLKSTAARVDARSIQARACFLCDENLPSEQRGILYRGEFLLLVNPYPILPEHFTIASVTHRPQRILHDFDSLLDLATDLAPQLLVLYNGPRCGASAPDHMHFQAGTKQFLPLVDDYSNARARLGRLLVDNGEARLFSVDRYLPSFLALESASPRALGRVFDVVYRVFQSVSGVNEEPLLNLVSWVDEGEWRVIVFPRTKHRPDRYFSEGKDRFLISPAAVDLAGVGVIPLEADFERLDGGTLKEMIEEVTLSPETFRDLTGAIAEALGA
jgi:hypothetical protein